MADTCFSTRDACLFLPRTVTCLLGAVVVLLLPGAAFSALLNEPCQMASDCVSANSYCAPYSLACRTYGSYCQCQSGYKEDQGRCKKAVSLGQRCSNDMTCLGEHVNCNVGTGSCDCDMGFVPDDFDTCSPAAPKGQLGDICQTVPIDTCGKNLECTDSICSCITGYVWDDNLQSCVTIGLGDSCRTDQDCFNVIRAVCAKQQCQCADGFQASNVTYKQQSVVACVANNNPLKDFGQTCSEVGSLQRSYCKQPYMCTKCKPDGSVSVCTVFSTSPNAPATLPTTQPPAPTIAPRRTTMSATFPALETTPQFDIETTPPPFEVGTTGETPTIGPKATTVAPLPDVLLGLPCQSDDDCRALFSVCSNNKTCGCADGYVRIDSATCREQFEQISLGAKCNAAVDTCASQYAACKNSVCGCQNGYKPGPNNDDCIEVTRVFGHSQGCSASNQCYYNLVCLQSKCVCSPGYKKTSFYGCKKRILQDQCSSGSSIECRFIDNAACSPDRYCECAKGYTRANSNSCVPLMVQQDTSFDGQSWTVPCNNDNDCITPVAPSLSRCLSPAKTCGCPPNTVYNQSANLCQYDKNKSDKGFGCTYDKDCPLGSQCVANTCGGSSKTVLSAATKPNTSAVTTLVFSSVVLALLLRRFPAAAFQFSVPNN